MQEIIYEKERNEVAYFMRRLYRQGLTTTSGGNVSCLTADGNVAISASQWDKGELQAEGVGIVSLRDGYSLTPELKLSIETGLHLAIYRARPDVKAIVHAHPVTATAFCATSSPINTRLTAEAYALLGDPVWIPYALMGTPELAENVAQCMQPPTVCGLMENHGVLTVAPTLLSAFDKLELLEVAARQTVLLKQIGNQQELTPARLAELDRFVGRVEAAQTASARSARQS